MLFEKQVRVDEYSYFDPIYLLLLMWFRNPCFWDSFARVLFVRLDVGDLVTSGETTLLSKEVKDISEWYSMNSR